MTTFPGGSKSRIDRAGNNVREGIATPEDHLAIEQWRAAHRKVLNTFQAILRMRTKGKQIVVAQRHKRRHTIYDKLRRLKKMQLSRMDDVAGCRLIFDTIDDLYAFRNSLHNANRTRFKHVRRNERDKYDYIKHPKTTGYRGIHDVYNYDVRSITGEQYKGLLVEIQYRTLIQHAWATTVEIIGFITSNQPKFQRGDTRYQDIMILASEILSRAFENMKGPKPELTNRELLEMFTALDSDLNLMKSLKGLNSSATKITNKKNAILIFNTDGAFEVRTYKNTTDALKALFALEKEESHDDIVLVKADTSDDVKFAFRNYFTDAQDFIRLMDDGCQLLVKQTDIKQV